jgi:hypothetical protein
MRCSVASLALLVQLGVTAAQAQELPRYYPLDHTSPGKAAAWNTMIDPSRCGRVQPVEITTPEGAEITVLNASASATAPVQADLEVGRSYRLRISNLTEFPGVEVYPSVEMLDHLHAPAGMEKDFAVPIEITAADIEAAVQNRLVTKVVYLEQPDIAIPKAQGGGLHTTDFPARTNLLQAADQRGRPIAIIRLGGRLPDLRNPDPAFLGSGGAVELSPIAGRALVSIGSTVSTVGRPHLPTGRPIAGPKPFPR